MENELQIGLEDAQRLLDISEAMTLVRCRQDFESLMNKKVQPILGFSEASIIQLNNDRTESKPFLKIKKGTQIRKARVPAKENSWERTTNTEIPWLLDQPDDLFFLKREEVAKLFPLSKTWPEIPGELEHTVVLKLNYASQVIGLWYLHFPGKIGFENQEAFLKSLSNQLAIVLSNVSNNEQVTDREKQKELLLEISEATTSIRNREDLKELLYTKVKHVLQFDDSFIVLTGKDSNTRQNFLILTDEETQKHQLFPKVADNTLPVEGTPFSYVLKQDDIYTFKVDDLLQLYPEYPGLKLMEDTGITNCISIKLRSKGITQGLLVFLYKKEESIGKREAFLTEIADQIRLSVNNILANEEILEGEKEKAELLKISHYIASIRGRDELFRVIFKELRPIFHFDNAVVVLANSDLSETQHLYTDAEGIDRENPNYKAIMAERVPVKGTPYEEILDLEAPVIRQIADLEKKYSEHIGVKTAAAFGLVEHVFMPLRFGGKTIGTFEFHSKLKGTFSQEMIEIYQSLSDQMAVAVSNILANEGILKIQEEKQTLLSISEELGQVREKEDFWDVVSSRLQPIFGFHDAVVIILPDKDHHSVFLHFASEDTKRHVDYHHIVNMVLPNEGSTIEWQLSLEKAQIIQLDDLMKIDPVHPGYIFMKELELEESFGGPLAYGGDKFGFLWFHYKEGTLPKDKLSMFQQVTDQVAATVSSILANEKILVEKSQKEALLSISEDITRVRSKEDLMQVIFDGMQPILSFDDAVVNLWEDDMTAFRMIASDQTAESPNLPEYKFFESEKHLIRDSGGYQEIVHFTEPHLSSVDFWAKKYPHFKGVRIMQKMGYVEYLVLPLYEGDQRIGVLEFHSKEKGKLQRQSMELFKGVADQVAIAVSNILANEEIVQREQEKALLLDISEAIASLKNAEDLYQVIFDKLQPVFNFGHITSLITYDIKDSVRVYFTTFNGEIVSGTGLDGLPNIIPLEGSAFNEVLEAPGAYSVVLEEVLNRFPGDQTILAAVALGIKQALITPLRYQGATIGSLHLHFDSIRNIREEELNLLNNLGDRLAVALSNLLANEKIIHRQKEKETLLSISEMMTSVRAKDDLARILNHQIKSYVNFQDVVVILINEAKGVRNHFISQSAPSRLEHPAHKIVSGELPIEGSPLEFVLKQGDYYGFETRDMIKFYPDHPGLKLMEDTGIAYAFCIKMRLSKKEIGVIVFHFANKSHFVQERISLYKGIADQFSLTINNIKANEEILREQKEKELQVELSNAMTSKEDWPERFLGLSKSLAGMFPFDYISYAIDVEGEYTKGCAYERIGFDEYRIVSATDFFKSSGMTFAEYQVERHKNVYKELEAFCAEDFKRITEKDRVKKELARLYDLNCNLNVPLLLSQDGQFQISLYSKGTHAYTKKHVSLMRRVLPSIVHPLEKMLAYEQIERLNEQLEHEKSYLMEEVRTNYDFEEIVGNSVVMQNIFMRMKEVAPLDTTVLLQGETGTGKELIARAIHNASKRRDKILIRVNCATLPHELIESELFGHERGAFTGAIKQRIGKFELADQGTIFLDEIGELSPELQAKLLRVLQEKEIERLGGDKPISVDFRVIAATNRDLEEEVKKGNFRADLYYRLHIFPIDVPPLRKREEDILAMARFFGSKYAQHMGISFKGFTQLTEERMTQYSWPGNVREMQNMIQQALITQRNKMIELDLVEKEWESEPSARQAATPVPVDNHFEDISLDEIKRKQDLMEKSYIQEVLIRTKWKVRGKNGAAEKLGINPTTLEYRMKRLGIDR